MRNFFAPVRKVLCPYCLHENQFRQPITACQNQKCKKQLKAEYVENLDLNPPFFTQIIGWSNVGKTVYLQSLTYALMKLGKLWKRSYAPAPLTNETLTYVQNVRTYMNDGKLPRPTQMKIQDAYIMQLSGMERWGSRTFVLRDVPGEVFNTLDIPIDYTPYLMHVPTTLLMVSLADLKTDRKRGMEDLINSYIHTIIEHDRDSRRHTRNVVVVLSKADLIINDLPVALRTYLADDPVIAVIESDAPVSPWDSKQMQLYMDKLNQTSSIIESWIGNLDGGQVLINRAKNNNIRLKFTIISSTGSQPGNNQEMLIKIQPWRVLDPFFWALDYQSQ
jgi:hypothetical protein